MARVARSDVATDMDVAPEMAVATDASDEGSPALAVSGRRPRPPRPRDGEVDDTSQAGQAENVHDQLVEAAHESAALEASTLEGSALEATTLEAADVAGSDVAVESAGSVQARVRTERTPLTDRERAMLEFERFWWRHAGSKEQAIRETFDLSATHYYRLLNALLDRPAAVEFDPLVVGRLRRLRASRARRRSGR